MTQELESHEEPKPLNARQRAFARELGVAIANGGRDEELVKAYQAAGYAPDRGNARRLAADPRVRTIADEACAEALRIAGLHIGYLQAKALELLHANPVRVHRALSKFMEAHVYGEGEKTAVRLQLRDDLTSEEEVLLDAVTWPLAKFNITKDGSISIELPDKKGIIEMLSKQLGYGKDGATAIANASAEANASVTLEQLVLKSLEQAA